MYSQVSVLWAPHCGGKQKGFNYDLIVNPLCTKTQFTFRKYTVAANIPAKTCPNTLRENITANVCDVYI